MISQKYRFKSRSFLSLLLPCLVFIALLLVFVFFTTTLSEAQFVCLGGPYDGFMCLSDYDCGKCVGGANDGSSCLDDWECPVRKYCVGGTNPGATCIGDWECPDRKYCDGGVRAGLSCLDDLDCPNLFIPSTCEGGANAGQSCSDDSDCPNIGNCESGAYAGQSCSDDSDCGPHCDSGTAEGGTSNTLTDIDKTGVFAWTTDEWANKLVIITFGTGVGQIRTIWSNTSDTLTVTPAWDAGGTPSTDTKYEIGVDGGTAESGTSNTLTDIDKTGGFAWITDQWANKLVIITFGTGVGQIRTIWSNTSDTLTVTPAWDAGGTPSTDTQYKICGEGYCDVSSYGSCSGPKTYFYYCEVFEIGSCCGTETGWCWGGYCEGYCGDGYCHYPDEDEYSCPEDCGYCGDGYCDWPYEDEFWCPEDCSSGGYCGDGYCDWPYENEFWCPEDCYETLIELVYFKATPHDSYVLIEWETDMEIDNAGFNIHRSEQENTGYSKINEFLIPAQGSGSYYSFTDNDVLNGTTYYYKLEDIDLNGVGTLHGPVSATPNEVVLLSPENNAVLSSETPPTFEWASDSYPLFKLVFEGHKLRKYSTKGWTTDTTFTPSVNKWGSFVGELGDGQTVSWSVKGKDVEGNKAQSETRSFTVE